MEFDHTCVIVLFQVTCVEPVTSSEMDLVEEVFSEHLQLYCGLVAVGLMSAKVFLIGEIIVLSLQLNIHHEMGNLDIVHNVSQKVEISTMHLL